TIAWTLGAALAAGLLAPLLVTLNFWHVRVERALSRSLGHPVTTRSIHLKLFGGLGFEIDNVRVEEDPRFGAEPLARMETLRATLAPRSLWSRRFEFSSLVFVHPSLNVVRNEQGRLNVETLWKAASAAASGGSNKTPRDLGADKYEPLPRIQIDQ